MALRASVLCPDGVRMAVALLFAGRVTLGFPRFMMELPTERAEDVGEPVGALIDHPPAAVRPDDRTIEPGYPAIPGWDHGWLSSARSAQIVPAPWLGWAAVSLPAEPEPILAVLLLGEELEHACPRQPVGQV